MLPSVVADELRGAVKQFLQNAFPIANPYFQGIRAGDAAQPTALIDELVNREGALFKGPYLDVQLPFRTSAEKPPFQHVELPFRPFRHQQQAFDRLSGEQPRSTIIATGTGSGKTECFMYPVLEDAVMRREPGIKTIIIYPMNALAADQARRFASEISKLDTKLTAGMYVGGTKDAPLTTHMSAEHVITDRDSLRENPPDILLTNYKMLDFLLIRPEDKPLWRHNGPGTLKYLVVDELHTFDGAQGTDLACLIRRLRERLQAGPDLVCIGTSATMGSRNSADLLRYASSVFASPFTEDALIREDRLSVSEYLHGEGAPGLTHFHWPTTEDARLDPANYPSAGQYIQEQAALWFPDVPDAELTGLAAGTPENTVRLGVKLRQHQAFHELLHTTTSLTDTTELAADWARRFNLNSIRHAELLLMSLTALTAAARTRSGPAETATLAPLLHVREQLWLRELRRIVCSVPAPNSGTQPHLAFADDLSGPDQALHLPLIHCRECHLAGWGATRQPGSAQLVTGLQAFYGTWFNHSDRAVLLIPGADQEADPGQKHRFCPHCHRLETGQDPNGCGNPSCGKPTIEVLVPDMGKDVQRRGATVRVRDDRCPNCLARNGLAIVGYRAATLISVMASRLFGTPYNDDRKLIAFSDSVQDAAHHAGFLGGSSWTSLSRQALARWLQKHGPVTLTEMREQLPGYWEETLGSAERFAGTFAAHNMMWLRDYRHLEEHGTLPAGSDLPDLVRKRLAWECVHEFGQRGPIGRSLERTGTAAIGFDPVQLFNDVRNLAGRLREELGGLHDLPDERVNQFVTGWLHHIRSRGALYVAELDSYLWNRGSAYVLSRPPWMPGFGPRHRPPAAVSLRHVADNFDSLTGGSSRNWYRAWSEKLFRDYNLLVGAERDQVYGLLLKTLAQAGWLIERGVSTGNESVYLLNPDRLLVTTDTAAARCDTCRHRLHFAANVADAYSGLPCLRPHCAGHLQAEPARHAAGSYGTTDPHRLVPHEHTGLLERELREQVEESFINGTQPWDYNLLSATPTLEMGIDIGELSTVFLCSVPPAQANYVQRIGRAGRRDGNSLAVTVANGRNHDLFFYADPAEMLNGEVATPGVFLHAQAVLERQLLAWCFDRWTATTAEAGAIPDKLRTVLNAVEGNQADRFPHTLFGYVKATRDELLSGFLALFPELGSEAREYLGNLLEPDSEHSINWRLLTRLTELAGERKALQRQARQLKQRIDRLEKEPKDDARDSRIDAMRAERSALLGLLSSLNGQQTLNFLTDEGVLPNYAFPEEGVTLQSVILRGTMGEEKDGRRYEKATYKFQRSAQAALGELAPEATFYAVSHKLNIDRVDLTLTKPEMWRFCDRCHYSSNVDTSDGHSACPRCGSPQWANVGQKHEVLKLRQVYSTEKARESRITDDSEQRDPVFFNRQMLIEIPPGGQSSGLRLKSRELPFGFEYVQKVILREVNFGQAAGGEDNVFTVAGDERSRRGFRLCRHCGTVQKTRPKSGEKLHTFTCELFDHPEKAQPDDFLESLFLYRELESEAVRILLPLSEIAYSDVELNSFVAALNLGLRLHYQGDVNHLQVTRMTEPATQDSGERVFLVIYDRIPGGTGYLKDLMRDPANLFRVLELAHEHLIDCDCTNDEELDGCYRCLLAYRDSRHLPSISRMTAAKLLGRIIAEREQTERVGNLSSISTNPLIESALEQRFLEALGNLPGARLSRELYQGKPGSFLTLPGADGKLIAWHVEHQVQLGPADGVSVNTEVDVLLTPARAGTRVRPIAVYMDGWQYHRKIIHDDVKKRRAILAAGGCWVITLTWDDLPGAEGRSKPVPNNLMRTQGPHAKTLAQVFASNALHAGTSMQLLEHWLRNPAYPEEDGLQSAFHHAFTHLRAGSLPREELSRELRSVATPETAAELAVSDPHTALGGHSANLSGSRSLTGFVVTLPHALLEQVLIKRDAAPALERLRVHLWLDDGDGQDPQSETDLRIDWRAFWTAANHLQFLPGFSFASRQAVTSGGLAPLPATATQVALPAEATSRGDPGLTETWREVLEFSVLDQDVLNDIRNLGVPAPEVGVDLTDDAGRVVLSGGEAELLWREEGVVVITGTEPRQVKGWTMIPIGDGLLDSLKTHLSGGAAHG